MSLPKCGTVAGYRQHLAELHHPCPDCRAAQRRQSARDWYRRNTGRTAESAFYADVHAQAHDRLRGVS